MKKCSPQDEIEAFACPVAFTVDVIGGKWKALILFHLMSGTKRFNELRRLMPDIAQRMLTLQLRELETDRVIHREIYREVPPKVEYSLTELGSTLMPLVRAMREWGAVHEHTILSFRRSAIDETPLESLGS
ncbi:MULTISPECIES: winged helix-turn-helix transcriptional regulator [unclassified Pseudomonas]|uniref:winged helix-turn-helix transcriptional regulator n=1 Tax=unclassified Pseudomonas TaxID=196821 RepID=UPI000C86D03F|nr:MULTISPECIES: winged helix-turn-helix transcriptional regulator [unclassified Pseudomonas]PMV22695.1 transcriptional regulator [Pseudomonas sp. FW305-3-2-15-C-TSA2]PMV29358.1 transcriptional regulator [Pseudomonas sp. DP16D-L5]PMV39261.1 transcriptional regulator [Pseudomonas sp. FW305-3-2-15-A-LB2]PMV45571.1 transcriptional regulator [Pseudomonas sp. FW305-3-2-15-C-R2A1]PMV51986.1 transcriptional regulator [Pseudomonas sp. FW305-3-2-15-C-LB1]